MPQMGEGVNEATVVRWLKTVGSQVSKDEPILEVATDKVDTEITAQSDGFLIAIFAQAGSTVAVNEVIAQLGATKDTPVRKPQNFAKMSKPAPLQNSQVLEQDHLSLTKSGSSQVEKKSLPLSKFQSNPMPQTICGSVRSSPLVRKMARDYGIDLSEVAGTGLYGRITKKDVEFSLSTGGKRVARFETQSEFDVPDELLTLPMFKVQTVLTEHGETVGGVVVRREKMSKVRRLTAEHMLRSVRTSPHVTTTFEMDLQSIVEHKTKFGEEWKARKNIKLTYTAYFIWASVQALKEFPDINALVDRDDILYRNSINIGCAVATDTGLIVPVIKNADQLNLEEIAAATDDIATRARNKKLELHEIKGGTFSITNPGIFGSLHSQPIINQPQSAILSIGAMIRKPVVLENDKLAIHPLAQVGLTFDHRLIDGEGGAKFLQHIKNSLENIMTLSH